MTTTAPPRAAAQPDPWRAPVALREPGRSFEPPPLPAGASPLGVAIATAVRIAVCLTLLGAPLGLIWSQVSPHPEVVRTAGSLELAQVETEAFFGADASFLLLTVAAGVLTAVALWLLRRERGPEVAVGLGVGTLAAAKTAEVVGSRVVLSAPLHALCETLHGCALYDGVLRVRATGVLVGWPLAALLTYAFLTAAFARDPADASAPWPSPEVWWAAPQPMGGSSSRQSVPQPPAV
ncbi:MAG: DUF2567 domain-containing protein [Mycobacteriales bacterium]|nr:DUF2567 domain-containing protein [Frankia sp.]